MEIRSLSSSELDQLADIDGTIESKNYVHIERAGEGLAVALKLEERALREKLIAGNPLDDEARFALRELAGGIEDGLALVAEHEGMLVASLAALVRPSQQTLEVVDLRVDYDYRRQGLGIAMLYRTIQEARERELRAVTATTLTSNAPAAHLLLKAGFILAGLDLQHRSNHDLVKEMVSLFWYAPLE